MVSAGSYILSAAELAVLVAGLGFSAVRLRARLLPAWDGRPGPPRRGNPRHRPADLALASCSGPSASSTPGPWSLRRCCSPGRIAWAFVRRVLSGLCRGRSGRRADARGRFAPQGAAGPLGDRTRRPGPWCPDRHRRRGRPGLRPLGPDDQGRAGSRHLQLRLALVPHAVRGGHGPEPLRHRPALHRHGLHQLVLPAELRAAARGRDPADRTATRFRCSSTSAGWRSPSSPPGASGGPTGAGTSPSPRRRSCSSATRWWCASPGRRRTTWSRPRCCWRRSRSSSTPGSSQQALGRREGLLAGRLAARRRRARRPGLAAGTKVDRAGDGGGADRRGDRAGAAGTAAGGGGLVVRAGAAGRRLLVPAQPHRRRQPAARGRPPRPDLPAAPRAAADRPARLQHRPLRDRHRRLARLLRARAAPGLRRALAAGRSAGRSSAAVLAMLWGRDRVVRWIGGVALFGMVAYLFTPLSAAGAEGAPDAFAINIRYLVPALLAPSSCCRWLAAFDGRRRQWALLARPAGRPARSPIAPTPSCATPRASSASCSAALVVLVPAALLYMRGPVAPPAARSLAGFAALALAVVAIGYPIQRHYLRDRFLNAVAATSIPGMNLDSAYRWARGIERLPASASPAPPPASSSTASTAPTSPTASSTWAPRARTAPSTRSPTCRAFRAAVNAADLDYLVTAPFLNFIHTEQPDRLARGGLAARRAGGDADRPQRPGHGLEGPRPPRPIGLRPGQRPPPPHPQRPRP